MKIDLSTAKSSELVDFYNSIADKKVARFSDRATAIKRILGNVQLLNNSTGARKFRIDGDVVTAIESAKNARVVSPSGDKFEPTERADAISDSWKDEAVAAARKERVGVEVDGVKYSSVAKAFSALGISHGKLIRFRLELKAKNKLEFEGKTWAVVRS